MVFQVWVPQYKRETDAMVWPAAEGLPRARCVCSACRRLRNDLFVVFSYPMGVLEKVELESSQECMLKG